MADTTTPVDNTIVLDEIVDVKAADITSPSPKEVTVETIANKGTELTVPTAPTVTYTQIDVDSDEELTNTVFHKPVETLKESVNTQLNAITLALKTLADTANSNTTKNTAEISNIIAKAVSDFNLQLKHIASANADQSKDAATAINRVKGDFITRLDVIVNRLVSNTNRLDTVEAVASGNSKKILDDFNTLKKALDALQLSEDGKDLDLIKEIAENKTRLNEMRIVHQFQMTVQPVNGIIDLNTRALNIGEFTDASEFVVNANIYDDASLQVSVINQTAEGCKLFVRSNGVSLKPRPVSNKTVKINVVLSHKPFVKMLMDEGHIGSVNLG